MPFCEQCGVKNDDLHRFCVNCGQPLPVLEAPAEPPTPLPPPIPPPLPATLPLEAHAPKTGAVVATCPACGNKGFVICGNCHGWEQFSLGDGKAVCHCGREMTGSRCKCGATIYGKFYREATEEEVNEQKAGRAQQQKQQAAAAASAAASAANTALIKKLSVGGLLVLLLSCCLYFWWETKKPQSDVSGAEATMVKKFYPEVPATGIGFEIAGEIYNLSVKQPNVRTLKVHFYVDKTGLVDHYGNKVTEDVDLGWKSFSTDPEAKKYESELRWLSTTNLNNIIGGVLCGDPAFSPYLGCN